MPAEFVGNDFEYDAFSYQGFSCFCGVDTINIAPGVIQQSLKIQENSNSPLYFAYGGATGLCRTTFTGSIRQENVLGELLRIHPNNIDDLTSFFQTNGYFFRTNQNTYEAIDIEKVWSIINRLKATVFLMSEIDSTRPDYAKMLHLALFLLLEPTVSIPVQKASKPYVTHKHSVIIELEKASSLPEIDGKKEAFQKDTYTIEDSIYGAYELNIDEYTDVTLRRLEAKRPVGYLDARYRDLVYLYRNGINLSKAKRLVVDFLFHYMHNVGVISNVTFDGGIEYYSPAPALQLFDAPLRKALINVSKIVLSEEINSNLIGIVPRYDVQRMKPMWKVSNLLSALYFSVFYLNPEIEIYRKCANPTCNNRFLVKTTNGRKIYCCPNCRNATAQRNHRKKMSDGKLILSQI